MMQRRTFVKSFTLFELLSSHLIFLSKMILLKIITFFTLKSSYSFYSFTHQIFITHYKVSNRVRWLLYFPSIYDILWLFIFSSRILFIFSFFIQILVVIHTKPKDQLWLMRAPWSSNHFPYTLEKRCLDGRISLIHIWIWAVVIWKLLWRKCFISLYMLKLGLVSSG